MNTIFVLIAGGELLEVAPTLKAEEALKHFTWTTDRKGEMYAARCSDEYAGLIREATITKPGKGRPSALTIAKTFSYSLTKCADVT